ncbi:helix-turn-helix domain-containing protein [Sphingorhabdus contaminans]|uniref:helix-turn-helix domain-containing protein n=1 Tax=Sphingorhabdus contaminans TaxID=1343899 RepID=UPI003D29F63C
MNIQQRLGKNVRTRREAIGLSQEAFADLAELHRTYISDIERGQRNPTIQVVEKIAVALNVSAGALLDLP